MNNFFDNSNDYNSLKKITCSVPFLNLQIFDQGDVSNCCYNWLPTYVGNVLENSLLEIINGPISASIRESVLDGSFKYCDANLCPKISEFIHLDKINFPLSKINNEQKIPTKKIHILLNYDRSCNLYCGSCRNERILYNEKTAPTKLKIIHQRVIEQLQELHNHGYDITLNITGSGDPFASPMYWSFLENYELNKNYRLELNTNGVLMTPSRLSLPFMKRVEFIGISIDAATENIYTKVRPGGLFKVLTQNLEHLDKIVKNGDLPKLNFWRMNFVVQKENYLEMSAFAKWALTYTSISQVWFNLIADWGHLDKESFEDKAVWLKEHPEHSAFLEHLKDPIFSHPKIFLGNVAQYRARA